MEMIERKRLKEIIIKKKMFKKPNEKLLTWAAKEQIRFLNSEYPEEWPVDRLAESFPVSRDSIISILKSRYIPRNDAEIIRHDERVHKHWQMLKKLGKENGKGDGGPIDPALNYLLESKKMKLLLHAGGHQSLPMPKQFRTQVRLAGLENKIIKPGPFSKIVLSYEQKVAEKSEKLKSEDDQKTDNMQQTPALLDVQDNVKLLESVVETFIPSKKMDSLPASETVSKNRPEEITLTPSPGNQNSNEVKSTKTVLSRREKRLLKKKDTGGLNINLTNLEQLQMMDTQKVVHAAIPFEDDIQKEIERKQVENSEASDEKSDFIISGKKGKRENVDTFALQYEETDISRGHGEKVHQPYIYDEKHGYQYPLGVIDQSLDSIKVPKDKKQKQKFYRKGDTVYDENGEFLYRIP